MKNNEEVAMVLVSAANDVEGQTVRFRLRFCVVFKNKSASARPNLDEFHVFKTRCTAERFDVC